MAWIESHQELGRHPKTIRLARMLGISLPQAIGHLHYLWWWALDFAQDGNLSGLDAIDVASAAKWDGDPEQFVQALVTCGRGEQPGFLDRNADGTLTIHDWYDYAGKLIEKRRADTERKRKSSGRSSEAKRNSSGTPTEFHRNSSGTPTEVAGNPTTTSTVPNPTVPKREEEGAAANWIRWYEKRTGVLPSQREMQDAAALMERGVTDELMIEAIKQAIDEKADRPIPYAIRIIANMQPYGVRTVEDWRRLEGERRTTRIGGRQREPTGLAALLELMDDDGGDSHDTG